METLFNGIVKNGCGYSSHESQKRMYGMKRFLACGHKFRQAENTWKMFWCDLLVHETLNFALSQEYVYKLSSLFACW